MLLKLLCLKQFQGQTQEKANIYIAEGPQIIFNLMKPKKIRSGNPLVKFNTSLRCLVKASQLPRDVSTAELEQNSNE